MFINCFVLAHRGSVTIQKILLFPIVCCYFVHLSQIFIKPFVKNHTFNLYFSFPLPHNSEQVYGTHLENSKYSGSFFHSPHLSKTYTVKQGHKVWRFCLSLRTASKKETTISVLHENLNHNIKLSMWFSLWKSKNKKYIQNSCFSMWLQKPCLISVVQTLYVKNITLWLANICFGPKYP